MANPEKVRRAGLVLHSALALLGAVLAITGFAYEGAKDRGTWGAVFFTAVAVLNLFLAIKRGRSVTNRRTHDPEIR
jgi:hypothetical protein